jgi:anti-sigma factor RsiW
MAERPPLTEQERADLVAYLDGELQGDAARAIEARLSLDPAVRAEAESLRRAWDMLDFLPRPAVSTHFTERTLSRLYPATAEQLRSPRRRWFSWLLAACWALALVAAFLAGWAGYEWLMPSRPSGTTPPAATSKGRQTVPPSALPTNKGRSK